MHAILRRGLTRLTSGRRRIDRLPDRAAIAKFDPEDVPSVAEIAATVEDGDFDAVQIGGTNDVSLDEMTATYRNAAAATDRDVYVEPGGLDHVAAGDVDLSLLMEPEAFTVPTVRNTRDGAYTVDEQNRFNAMIREQVDGRERELLREAAGSRIAAPFIDRMGERTASRYVHEALNARMVPESYVVLNPDANVATKSGADAWLDGRDGDPITDIQGVIDTLYQQAPGYDGVVYFEASGGYAPPHLVAAGVDAIRENGGDPAVWYGGGIGTDRSVRTLTYRDGEHPADLTAPEQAAMMYDAGVDAVLVGNAIQE